MKPNKLTKEEIKELKHQLPILEKIKRQENKELKSQLKIKDDGFKAAVEELCEYAEENEKIKEDIQFCLHSIKQEMEMSTDSRTKSEMESCYRILKRWVNE